MWMGSYADLIVSADATGSPFRGYASNRMVWMKGATQ